MLMPTWPISNTSPPPVAELLAVHQLNRFPETLWFPTSPTPLCRLRCKQQQASATQQAIHLRLLLQILRAMCKRNWKERERFREEDARVSAMPYPKRRHLEEVARMPEAPHRPGIIVHAPRLAPIAQELRILQRSWKRMVEEMREEYTGYRTDLLPPLSPLEPEIRLSEEDAE